MSYYDIDKLVLYCTQNRVNISPQDMKEWIAFGHALKVLGYGIVEYEAMSNEDVYYEHAERLMNGLIPSWCDETWAAAKICYLAKQSGRINMREFISEDGRRDNSQRHRLSPIEEFTAVEKEPPLYIPDAALSAMAADVQRTPLFSFLSSKADVQQVEATFAAYRVGATRHFKSFLATVWPYINYDGQCVDAHYMAYGNDGHRLKSYGQTWYMAVNKCSERRGTWPLFGEHLLNSRPQAPVGVVEAAKTAVIASIFAPNVVWVATGSLSNLSAQRLDRAQDRALYLFPDADAIQQWEDRAAKLKGFNITMCSEFIKRHAVGAKDDLADILLR